MKKIALGTVQFGLDYGVANEVGQVKSAEVQQILFEAKKNKIDMLDTAIAYGTSEVVLGGAGIDGFRVVTKLPALPTDQSDIGRWVRDHVNSSLKRLKQETLHALLLHRAQDLLGIGGAQLIQALRHLKSAGIVQKIGISIYDPEELNYIRNKIKIDIVQAPLSVIDRRMETGGSLDRLKDQGVEIHARSVFLQGLLLMERNKIPEQFLRWSSLWDLWHQKLRDSRVSPLEVCLAYPLALEQVDQVIVGVDSARQLQDILAATCAVDHTLDSSFMISTDANLINPSNWSHS
ncbi:aldo/keto reductase [Candidatus Puniceispirillum sp.]|nr:aldo/keto reductase [Candidatus Puniceispirillum sp.]